MGSTSGKKKASIELDFTKHTKHYERFDAADPGSLPFIKNFYMKSGALDFDPDSEKIKVTVEVIKQ